VIVTSSSAKSYFFGAGENKPPNGDRRYWTVLIPSFLAIACESAYSKPEGFLILGFGTGTMNVARRYA